ncbi:hypothetical protein [Mariprofundus sp. EBB-1]|uniref:hypothetical protein n=1 Tax=Mariprofundus sp. EBB-1 TaxID=2650971 RepID=UPI0011C4419F|nr:hypothetical protein [Mariprofundus sp. EBB-1]
MTKGDWMLDEKQHLNVDADHVSRQLLMILVGCELMLVLLDIVINYMEIIPYKSMHALFNIAREDGLAGWFMTSQTMIAALVLWFIYYLSHHIDGITAFYRRSWLILALFFSYMSADDGAVIHERMGTMFEDMMANPDALTDPGLLTRWLDLFPSYEWQFLLPIFALIGLYMLYFLWKVLGVSRALIMVLAAFSSLSVAVVLDFIEGMPPEHAYNLYSWLKQTYMLEDYTVDHFAKSLEESLEMLGISLFLAVFVAQIKLMLPENFSIHLQASKGLPEK